MHCLPECDLYSRRSFSIHMRSLQARPLLTLAEILAACDADFSLALTAGRQSKAAGPVDPGAQNLHLVRLFVRSLVVARCSSVRRRLRIRQAAMSKTAAAAMMMTTTTTPTDRPTDDDDHEAACHLQVSQRVRDANHWSVCLCVCLCELCSQPRSGRRRVASGELRERDRQRDEDEDVAAKVPPTELEKWLAA